MATQVQQQSVSDTATTWSADLPFAEFDVAQGALQAIGVGLSGDVAGMVAIENLQPMAANAGLR